MMLRRKFIKQTGLQKRTGFAKPQRKPAANSRPWGLNVVADRTFKSSIDHEKGGINRRGTRWTLHARDKMNFYRLSPARVSRVLNSPKRIEEGVAPKTIAAMQPVSMKTATKWSQEIWVMYEESPNGKVIISAWRYPGVTKARDAIQIKFMKNEYLEYKNK